MGASPFAGIAQAVLPVGEVIRRRGLEQARNMAPETEAAHRIKRLGGVFHPW